MGTVLGQLCCKQVSIAHEERQNGYGDEADGVMAPSAHLSPSITAGLSSRNSDRLRWGRTVVLSQP